MTDDRPPTRAPQPLDYPSPPLSAYDRPVEPVVTFARRFKIAIRIAYLIFIVAVVGIAVWGAFWLRNTIDTASGGR